MRKRIHDPLDLVDLKKKLPPDLARAIGPKPECRSERSERKEFSKGLFRDRARFAAELEKRGIAVPPARPKRKPESAATPQSTMAAKTAPTPSSLREEGGHAQRTCLALHAGPQPLLSPAPLAGTVSPSALMVVRVPRRKDYESRRGWH